MSDAAINAVLRRDRAVVLGAIVVTVGLAWAYIVWLARNIDMGAGMGSSMGASMGGPMGSSMGPSMDSGTGAGMSMGTMLAPAFRPWSAAEFTFTFVMWSVMMVGMMLPSVTPMVLLYAAAGRKAAATGTPLAATGWFVAGYLLAWVAFSLAATVAQWQLGQFALITPMLSRASDLFGGVVLVVAGLYQWSPLKDACLAHCQSPFGFLIGRGGFRTNPWGSLRLGIEHGALCVGCCWVLMALLFVGGVMNLLWIAGLAIFILLEKIVPTGRLVPRVAGAAMLATGLFLLYRSL